MATEDEAGTYRTTVAGGLLSRNYADFLVSRGVVDVTSLPQIPDDLLSSPAAGK